MASINDDRRGPDEEEENLIQFEFADPQVVVGVGNVQDKPVPVVRNLLELCQQELTLALQGNAALQNELAELQESVGVHSVAPNPRFLDSIECSRVDYYAEVDYLNVHRNEQLKYQANDPNIQHLILSREIFFVSGPERGLLIDTQVWNQIESMNVSYIQRAKEICSALLKVDKLPYLSLRGHRDQYSAVLPGVLETATDIALPVRSDPARQEKVKKCHNAISNLFRQHRQSRLIMAEDDSDDEFDKYI